MGQKVHPVGFRVGITKPYQSQWFARFQKYQYAQTILEDRLLRETLMTLFPKLLNPKLNVIKKRYEKAPLSPKITHIKIERGLIPYQIGIQIHSENSEVIKSAIENLKISNSLKVNLQKVRQYLLLFRRQKSMGNLASSSTALQNINLNKSAPDKLVARNGVTILPAKLQEKKDARTKARDSIDSFSHKAQTRLVARDSLASGVLLVKKKDYKKYVPRTWSAKKNKERSPQKRRVAKSSMFLIQKKASRYTASSVTMSFFKKQAKKKTKQTKKKTKQINTGSRFEIKSKKTTKQIKTGSRWISNRFLKKSSKNLQPSFAALTAKIRNIAIASANQTTNKIFNIFLTKTSKKFFKHLKEQIKYWNQQTQVPAFGSNKKWSLKIGQSVETSFIRQFPELRTDFRDEVAGKKSQSIYKLRKLVQILEKKAFIKMNRLRNYFITTGPLSKAHTYGYYQIINYLKSLKEYIKKQRILQISMNSPKNSSISLYPVSSVQTPTALPVRENLAVAQVTERLQTRSSAFSPEGAATQLTFIPEHSSDFSEKRNKKKTQDYITHRDGLADKVFIKQPQIEARSKQSIFNPPLINQSKLANVENQYRKIKFIEYLKEIVQKHRQNNIYYYLSTIAVSRKNIRTIKQFTKDHSTLLFGVDSNNLEVVRNNIKESIEQPTNILQVYYLKKIEKEKKIEKKNCELTPKISIKFYTAPSNIIETKATIVADTVVDALEKRQAFRKVIKQAMAEAMKNPRVKGVKIQVAGRLNGAEIARTEWVRSGRVPLQTLTANLDYSYKTASTIYGRATRLP